MADRNSRVSVGKKEKKVENKANEEKGKAVKKSEKLVKKTEKTPEQPKPGEEKRNGGNGGTPGAEADFQPIELPPFEIVTGWVWFLFHTFQSICHTLVLLLNESCHFEF